MNSHVSFKIRSTISDLVLALLVFLFFILAVMSPTIGNTSFYSRQLRNGAVTTMLQEELREETKQIAEKTGIEPGAFDFAVGQNKISTVQREIVKSAFSGGNYDYSDSSNIEACYRDGITEYYRYNGMPELLDEGQLEIAVPMACKAFNNVMGIQNNKEFKSFSNFLSKLSIPLAVAVLILIVTLGFRIFNVLGGSTRVLAHYASSIISAGAALALLFAANAVLGFSSRRLYLTSNEALNFVLAGGSNFYFLIELCFGIALIIAGASMLTYVDRHYTRKAQKQKQERDINKTLYVANQFGDDKTIGEIVSERRKNRNKSDE